jgi:predicted metal-dependent hydrolase
MNSSSAHQIKETKTNQTFQYGNKTVEYTLIQSKRRKTFEVIVDKELITIRAPFDKSIREIEQILNDKIKWISQKQKELQNEKPEIVKPSFDNNSTLPYIGKNCNVKVILNIERSKEKIKFSDGVFIVYFEKENEIRSDRIRCLYNDWLVSQANQIFKEKVSRFSKIMEVNPNKISIKNLKNRWGSVTKNKTINLNVNLMKAPEDIIDYIIIHELCHLKIKGHSYQFWEYLKQFVPDYGQKIEWLGRNTDSLLT